MSLAQLGRCQITFVLQSYYKAVQRSLIMSKLKEETFEFGKLIGHESAVLAMPHPGVPCGFRGPVPQPYAISHAKVPKSQAKRRTNTTCMRFVSFVKREK